MAPELLAALLSGCAERGLRTATLDRTARSLEAERPGLPRCALTRAAVPGFAGEVSWQEQGEPAAVPAAPTR
jgi:hypothetical protein